MRYVTTVLRWIKINTFKSINLLFAWLLLFYKKQGTQKQPYKHSLITRQDTRRNQIQNIRITDLQIRQTAQTIRLRQQFSNWSQSIKKHFTINSTFAHMIKKDTDRLTDRQTDRLITILRSLCRRGSNTVEYMTRAMTPIGPTYNRRWLSRPIFKWYQSLHAGGQHPPAPARG